MTRGFPGGLEAGEIRPVVFIWRKTSGRRFRVRQAVKGQSLQLLSALLQEVAAPQQQVERLGAAGVLCRGPRQQLALEKCIEAYESGPRFGELQVFQE